VTADRSSRRLAIEFIVLASDVPKSDRVEVTIPLIGTVSIVDRLDELLVLTTILDAGSLAAAARRLRRSPPAMTRSLAALEARVGARLVQRTTRRLTPTAAGRRLASRARQLLADYEQATRASGEERDAPLHGVLRVTAPSIFGRWHIAPLVSRFLDAHSGVRVELVLTNRNLDLVEEGLDVAVRIGPVTESGLVARRVGQVRWVVFASPDYVARRGRPRTPRDLIKHDIIYESFRPSPVEWRFRAYGASKAVRLNPRFMATDEAVLVAVKAGRGIGRTLSYQVADDLASGALVRLLGEFEPPAWPVHLVVPTTRYMPRTVRAFLDMAAPALSRLRAIHQ
jgi:DNA-binding transcriptional LysR family regulator